jgi:hypothetical protein
MQVQLGIQGCNLQCEKAIIINKSNKIWYLF